MAGDPRVSATNPIPVPANPHKARLRRLADDLDLRGRRSHTDGAHVDRGCGNPDGAPHDAASEERRCGQGCEQHGLKKLSAFHWYWFPTVLVCIQRTNPTVVDRQEHRG
jgi:hypothetical protein